MPQRVSGEVLIFLLHTKMNLLSPCKHWPKKDQWSNKTTQEKK